MKEVLIDHIQAQYLNGEHRRNKESELTTAVNNLERVQARLLRLAETTDDPPEDLVSRLSAVGKGRREAQAKLDAFRTEMQTQRPEFTRAQIEARLREFEGGLINMGPEMGWILEQLIPGKIRAVPHQQFQSNKVVLRAEFDLHLVNVLPVTLHEAIAKAPIESADWAVPKRIVIDLFEISQTPKYALDVVRLHDEEGLTFERIGKQLGTNKNTACASAKYGRQMIAAGITDPYIRLAEAPAAASRWRTQRESVADEASPAANNSQEGLSSA